MVYGSDGSGRCDPDPLLVAKVYLVTARTSRLPTMGAVFCAGPFNAAYKKIPEPIHAIGVRDGGRGLAGWYRA